MRIVNYLLSMIKRLTNFANRERPSPVPTEFSNPAYVPPPPSLADATLVRGTAPLNGDPAGVRTIMRISGSLVPNIAGDLIFSRTMVDGSREWTSTGAHADSLVGTDRTVLCKQAANFYLWHFNSSEVVTFAAAVLNADSVDFPDGLAFVTSVGSGVASVTYVPTLGTPAAFLGQECIVSEECFFKCVRLSPVKWIGPFPAL